MQEFSIKNISKFGFFQSEAFKNKYIQRKFDASEISIKDILKNYKIPKHSKRALILTSNYIVVFINQLSKPSKHASIMPIVILFLVITIIAVSILSLFKPSLNITTIKIYL